MVSVSEGWRPKLMSRHCDTLGWSRLDQSHYDYNRRRHGERSGYGLDYINLSSTNSEARQYFYSEYQLTSTGFHYTTTAATVADSASA